MQKVALSYIERFYHVLIVFFKFFHVSRLYKTFLTFKHFFSNIFTSRIDYLSHVVRVRVRHDDSVCATATGELLKQ